MRTLALLLLMLNLAFVTWQLNLLPWLPWQPDQFSRQYNNTQPSQSVPNSPLVFKKGELPALNQNQLESVNDKVGLENHLKSRTIERSESMPLTEIASLAEKESMTTEEKSQENKPTTETMGHLSQLQEVAGLPISDRVKSETKVKSNEAPNPPINSNVSTKNNVVPNWICFQTRLYNGMSKVKRMAHWLKKNEERISVHIQSNRTRVLESTWVYLPPFNNRQNARRAEQRLQKQGIEDHIIVTKGPFNNAISLGRYRHYPNVERRLKQLEAKGYHNVKIQKYHKNDTKYRLNVKMLKAQDELLQEFKKNFSDTSLKLMACHSIALNSEIP